MLADALLLLAGVLACSTSVIFIKASSVDPALLSGLRLLLAAALLAPFLLRARRRHPGEFGWREARRAFVPGVVLAVHFITWVAGARATLAANATLIVNMVPLAMPFLLTALADERITRRELGATALGFAGISLISAGDIGSGHWKGDFICFGSMLLFALYLTLGRRNRAVASLWFYVVPLYAIGGSVCLVLGATGLTKLLDLRAEEWLWVFGLALVPTVAGHSLLNGALQHFRGSTVSVCNIGQFVFAGLAAWGISGELPGALFWPAALLVVAGALLVLWTPRGRAGARPPW